MDNFFPSPAVSAANPSASAPISRGNYVLLRADTLRLILPQHEVGQAEYVGAGWEAEQPDALGTPLLALSSDMRPLAICPPDRFLATTLGNQEMQDIRWCWNEVEILMDTQLDILPLPEALIAPYTPITHYVEHKGKIAYLCDARQLRDYALSGL